MSSSTTRTRRLGDRDLAIAGALVSWPCRDLAAEGHGRFEPRVVQGCVNLSVYIAQNTQPRPESPATNWMRRALPAPTVLPLGQRRRRMDPARHEPPAIDRWLSRSQGPRTPARKGDATRKSSRITNTFRGRNLFPSNELFALSGDPFRSCIPRTMRMPWLLAPMLRPVPSAAIRDPRRFWS